MHNFLIWKTWKESNDKSS